MIHITTTLQTFDAHKVIAKVGQQLLDSVIENIKKGVNNDGQSYIPYAPSYAVTKGRSMPDLKVTGRMLSSLNVMFKSTEMVIGVFGDRNQVAEYLNAHKNWSFLTWGKLLDVVYEKVMDESFKQIFDGGQK